MLRLKLTLILCLLFGVVQAQPYLATRAAIYDQGPDPYFPPTDVAEPDGYRVEIWRYIPGSRFESGLDLRIEEAGYDPQDTSVPGPATNRNRDLAWTKNRCAKRNRPETAASREAPHLY